MKSTKRCHKKGLNKAMLRPPPPSAFVVEREGIKPKFLLPSYAAASIRSDSILCATACAKMAAGSLFSSSRNSSSMCAAWWVSLCTSFIRSSSSEANKLLLCFSARFSNQSNTLGDSIEWGKIHLLSTRWRQSLFWCWPVCTMLISWANVCELDNCSINDIGYILGTL